jgi:predicted phosphate transport protein (TIGR00153 family)
MRLLPQENKFFDFFNQHAAHAVEAAVELRALLNDLSELPLRVRSIEHHEKQADKITHQTIQLLHQTFVTPLDRDEIHRLITTMDDVLDLLEGISQCLFLYDVRAVPPEAKRLADICVVCTEKVRDAVAKLQSMDNADAILRLCAEIDRLESDADQVMHGAMAKLFREEPDAIVIIKLKEIYQLLELVTDKCEDVANLIEGIVLENG